MNSALTHTDRVRRRVMLALRAAVLFGFAVFFVVPLAWLVLASTKTDYELVNRNPFAFGSFHNVWLAWQRVDGFQDHIYLRWLGNSLFYSLTATAITLVCAIPAGYGLAFGQFPGRKLILRLTLIVMIMPSAVFVLPIFHGEPPRGAVARAA